MFINFAEIQGHHNLFLDYLYEYDNVKEFYKINFRDKEEYPNYFSKILNKRINSKINIHDIVLNQYKDFIPSQKTLNNISKLISKNTLTVVTGQQLGILGGPLYTLFKTITAIKLASHLSEKYDELNFIPIFWLEGDDHDFDEVKSINLIDEKNELIKIEYNDSLPPDDNRGSVGNYKFQATINQFLNDFEKYLRQTEFRPKILELLKQYYYEHQSFKIAFKNLLFSLFDNYGLIIFDPQEEEVKKLLAPVFKNEIENFRTHSEKLILKSARLEEVYHAQVKIKPINLFMNYEYGRYAIEPIENNFRLKNKRVKFSQDELLGMIEEKPYLFSPNVILRPICQDYLFPTAFYVGGPSEVSYFAQIIPLYEYYNLQPPIIYPRSSATLLEKNIIAVLEKYNIKITDIFVHNSKLIEKVISNISQINVDEIFNNTNSSIKENLNELKIKLSELEKTTSDLSEKYIVKISSYLDEFKTKIVEVQKKKHETAIRQIQKVISAILPNNDMQERELNYFYFSNKYGLDLINFLFHELAINKFEHQLIYL